MASIGISINDRRDEQLVEEFDETFDCGPDGSRSRSEVIKSGMVLLMQVAPPLEEFGYSVDEPREMRGPARQAIFDYVRKHTSDDDS